MFLTLIGTLLCCSLTAQRMNSSQSEVNQSKEIGNYQKLKTLGYSEKEIFEDLGNANFLLEKYESAAFWYKKLLDHEEGNAISANYEKRYQFALEQVTNANTLAETENNNDWLAEIRNDYTLKKKFEAKQSGNSMANNHGDFDLQLNYRSQSLDYLVAYERDKGLLGVQLNTKKDTYQDANEMPAVVTENGKTAYFSKAVFVKPATGIFSKKELVHKIYRTDKINGQWKNVREVALAPDHYSAMHPAISTDGKRLFFTSNMPGTYGKYDIYAADISSNGAIGQAKNLGTKVNTKKNDMYPSLLDGNNLVFASEGREGYGGLDLYMSQVGQKKVGWATNLGSPINSSKDDFSMYVMAEKGIGYVLSNRGKNSDGLQQVAFSYSNDQKTALKDRSEYDLSEALDNNLKIDFTTSVFEEN